MVNYFFALQFPPNLYLCGGGMSEWSNEAVLKTVVLKGTGGSNPSSSAI